MVSWGSLILPAWALRQAWMWTSLMSLWLDEKTTCCARCTRRCVVLRTFGSIGCHNMYLFGKQAYFRMHPCLVDYASKAVCFAFAFVTVMYVRHLLKLMYCLCAVWPPMERDLGPRQPHDRAGDGRFGGQRYQRCVPHAECLLYVRAFDSVCLLNGALLLSCADGCTSTDIMQQAFPGTLLRQQPVVIQAAAPQDISLRVGPDFSLQCVHPGKALLLQSPKTCCLAHVKAQSGVRL